MTHTSGGALRARLAREMSEARISKIAKPGSTGLVRQSGFGWAQRMELPRETWKAVTLELQSMVLDGLVSKTADGFKWIDRDEGG